MKHAFDHVFEGCFQRGLPEMWSTALNADGSMARVLDFKRGTKEKTAECQHRWLSAS